MSLILSLEKKELADLVDHQLRMFMCSHSCEKYIDKVLARAEICFKHVNVGYYHVPDSGDPFFSPFHSEQYAQFLYFLSNEAYLCGDRELAEKAYYLNKSLNGVEWFYEVKLPEIFYAAHPAGCVLGRAEYSDHFVVSQGCTVGNNHDKYPKIGENVIMHPYSMVIGDSHIGRYVEISAYSFIRDEDIPDYSIVFGSAPNLEIIRKPKEDMKKRFLYFF